ncbi:hypothetical protein BH20ACT3_BH20ACT3_04260 [soil metagenome]
MNSGRSADAELARRDPAVPGLGVALTPEALGARLAPLMHRGWDPEGLSLSYVRYKPGTGVVGALELRTPAGTTYGFVKAMAPEGRVKLESISRASEGRASELPVVLDDALALIVAPAILDRRLPGAAARLRSDPTAPRPEVLRYKPERRLVARDGDRLVKLHRPESIDAIVAAHRALTGEGGRGAPRPAVSDLGWVDAKGGRIESPWIDGTALDGEVSTPRQLAEVGALLAGVHRCLPTGLEPGPPVVTLATEAVEAIAVLDPRLRPLAERVAAGALHVLSSSSAAATAVHGDFSADQVLRTPRGLVLIDLDRVCVDEPAVDIAGWAAERLCIPPPRPVAGDVVDLVALPRPAADLAALVEGYRLAGGTVDDRRVAARTALAVLARAVEPFRFRHRDWPDEVAALVRVAGSVVGGVVAA